jgi:hypothetical protein
MHALIALVTLRPIYIAALATLPIVFTKQPVALLGRL